jgi:aryl-alcohol dehydrogenase-like predicted oxidoreductase
VESRRRGLGVIAKRPVANAPWRFPDCPKGDYAEEYWWRWTTMKLDPRGLDWQELAVRFSAFTPGVHSIIIGTGNEAHLARNAELISRGPLPDDHVAAIREAFRANDPGWWRGEV